MLNLPDVRIFWGFVVSENLLPKYTQYNFDFPFYSIDYNLEGKSKYDIFLDFWIRSGNSFENPLFVPDDLKKYFFPITNQIIDYINYYGFSAHVGYLYSSQPAGAVPTDVLLNNQFDLIYWSEIELPRVQDYFYEDKRGIYTKSNFKFDMWSEDFGLYGTKLFLITSFLIKNQLLSGVIYDSSTYGLYDGFRKYFDETNLEELNQYLINFSVCSSSNISFKNTYNIDWEQYKIVNKLILQSIPEIINNWYLTYQFERKITTFFPQSQTDIDRINDSVATIITEIDSGSGTLINYPGGDYILTVNHIFQNNPNIRLFLATFEYTNISNVKIVITVQFRIIGKDTIYDLVLGKFDPTLPFNIQAGIKNLSDIPKISITSNIQVQNLEDIFLYGTFGFTGISVYTPGKVIKNSYTGPFASGITDANYIMASVSIAPGLSGGPQFVKRDNKYFYVAMTQRGILDSDSISLGITVDILNDFISTSIRIWDGSLILYGLNYNKLDLIIDNAYLKSWLGVSGTYYDKQNFYSYTTLQNFYYTGGYIVDAVINGFNYSTGKFLYNTFDLNNLNTIQLFSPFSGTKISERLISTNSPIVIKKLSYFDSLADNYVEYVIGKYDGQTSLYKFYLGFQSIGTYFTAEPIFLDAIRLQLPILNVTYSYYNGLVWIDDTESIGGNGPEWYCTYTTPAATIKVNKFSLPPFLVYYISDLLYASITNNLGWQYNTPTAQAQAQTASASLRSTANRSGMISNGSGQLRPLPELAFASLARAPTVSEGISLARWTGARTPAS
jgi:hypothetical protein